LYAILSRTQQWSTRCASDELFNATNITLPSKTNHTVTALWKY